MSAPTGIIGGVFDPVHNGHLAMASLAREFFGLESVLFIPSGNPPHKNMVMASPDHRLAMLRIALEDISWAHIWDRELFRHGYSYTIDTITELRKEIDNPYYFIVGSDNLCEIPSWYHFQKLLNMITLCVTHRPGHTDEVPVELQSAKIVQFPSPEWGLSSSLIRLYVSKGYSCKYLIPDAVIQYIQHNNLYT